MVAVGECLCGDEGEGAVQKVHHVAVEQVLQERKLLCSGQEEALGEAIRHVADDAGHDECPSQLQELGAEEIAAIADNQQGERHHLHSQEEERRPRRAVAHAKSHARVVQAQDTEVHDGAVGDNGCAIQEIGRGQVVVEHDIPLAYLIQQVKEEDKQNEEDGGAFHGLKDPAAHVCCERRGNLEGDEESCGFTIP